MPRQAESGRAQITGLLEACPSIVWHWCRDGLNCQGSPGMPDLIVCGPRGVLFREVKPPHRGPRPGQVNWKYKLKSAGASWAVWTLDDLESGLIEAELDAIS